MTRAPESSRAVDRTLIHFDGVIFGLQGHGGIRRVFENLISRLLQDERVEFTFSIAARDKTAAAWLPSPVVRPMPSPAALRPGRLFRRVNESLSRRAAQRHWASLRGGVFVSTYYTTFPAIRIPQLLFAHDMIFELFPDITQGPGQERHKAERKASIAAAHAILCPSESARSDLFRLFPVEGKLVRVIPYGVSPEFAPADGEAPARFRREQAAGQPFFLHVGQRAGTKNFMALLMAFSRWKGRNDIHLLTAGGGNLSNEENSVLRALRLKGLVHCCPRLNMADLVAAYSAAEGCLVPSLYEGFGFPVLEALACGTPVASSNQSSLPEVGGDAAIYFDPTDTDQMVSAMDLLAGARQDAKLRERGLAHARRFPWERTVESLIDMVRETEARFGAPR